MRNIGLAVVMFILLSLFTITVLPYQAAAAPIYFEEDFRSPDCPDATFPSSPHVWTQTGGSAGEKACDSDQFNPTDGGGNSFRQELTSGVIHTMTSPAIDISAATSFSVGFAIRFEEFPGSTFGGAFQFVLTDADAPMAGFGVSDDGSIHTVDVNSIWQPQFGTDLVLDTWYVVRFDIDRDANTYALYINNTVRDASQSMVPAGADHEMDGLRFSDRSSGKAWIDDIFSSAITITAIANQTLCVGVTLSLQPASDATNILTWAIDTGPSWMTITASTGLLGGEPASSDIAATTVTISATGSAGSDTESFLMTVESCGGGGVYRIIVGGGLDCGESVFFQCPIYEVKDPCTVGETEITFSDRTADPRSVLIYVWDFGDGSRIVTTTNPNVTHTFPGVGIYMVTQAVFLSDGTVFQQTKEVDVGVCETEQSAFLLNLIALIIALAVILWLTFVFTRGKKLMVVALIFTLVAASGWAVFLL